MENTNVFDTLPNEVFQLIFAAVADCKTLVRCMVVSKLFKEQSSRITSLSITCLGQFSSYDQKLKGIYNMIKEFQLLESLIVRVGHPKDEPPSWARCMRYAEIGTSVEKFIFMAAKSGDFSEFDNVIGGEKFNENDYENKQSRNAFSNINSGFSNNQIQNVWNYGINGNVENESIISQRCYIFNTQKTYLSLLYHAWFIYVHKFLQVQNPCN